MARDPSMYGGRDGETAFEKAIRVHGIDSPQAHLEGKARGFNLSAVNKCEHKYVFQYVVTSLNDRFKPGGSAQTRYLEDRMICERCLDTKDINKRECGNSYSKPIAGSFPK